MARFFLRQVLSEENVKNLLRDLSKTEEVFEERVYKIYCTLQEDIREFEKKIKRGVLEYSFMEIDNSDSFFGIVYSDKYSEGITIEINYAAANEKRVKRFGRTE